MKKILSIFFLLLSFVFLSSFKINRVYEISNNQEWIEISTYEELCSIPEGTTLNYKLINDINCENKPFVPIKNFKGVFNGGFHYIENLPTSLFDLNDGRVANVLIKNGLLESDSRENHSNGIASVNWGSIDSCGYIGDILVHYTKDDYGQTPLGGICSSNYGDISNCYYYGDIRADGDGFPWVGGIVGGNYPRYGLVEITNCYVVGNISSLGKGFYNTAGGIVGDNVGAYSYCSYISNCYYYGNIFVETVNGSSESSAGAIVGGSNHTNTKVQNCYYVKDKTNVEVYSNSSIYINDFGLQVDSVDDAITKCNLKNSIFGELNYKNLDNNYVFRPIYLNVENGKKYITEVVPYVEGTNITLNNETYDGKTKICEYGQYELAFIDYYGYQYNILFYIGFNYKNVEDGQTYVGSVTPNIEGGTITLDGQPYTSGKTITEVGNHTIVITASNGYTEKITFTILPEISGIQDGQTYVGSVTPNIEGGTITLDGQPYESGQVITEVGNHTIIITGSNGYRKTISFTILPLVEGIEDGGTYSGSVTPNIEGGIITLDGQPYESGQVITEVGNHTIIITGSNGYRKTISFTILPLVEGIEDGGTYSGSVTPNIEGGIITLDGQPYDGVSTITEPGTHVIKITGVNGYEQTISFSIGLVDSGIKNNDELVLRGSLTFSGGTATLDGKPYTSGQVITEVGNHTIIITGSNGYSKTINFTILPKVSDIQDGQTYSGSVTPNIEGGIITLDGQPYDGVSTITEPGEHTIKIVGANGYEQEIKFNIVLVTSGIENGAEYYESISYNFSGGIATLDGKPYTSGQTINEVGNHTIVITGANGYIKTISFTIKAIDYAINSNDHSWQISINNIHPNTTVTIDGKEINGSYSEDAIGNHTLIIRNGDYEEVINFTIKENLTFADGDVFTDPLVLDDINGQIYVDGVLVENGYRIDQNGIHEIRIVGTNGYESIIIIEYRNPNYFNAFMMLIPISIICVGIIYVVIRRRRVI